VLFRASGITKSFPPVQALCDVDLELLPGRVHALVGENGAGKSTLARIIAGIETPDAGRMSLEQADYRPRNRAEAERLGIRMVMQELNVIPTLTVAENIFVESLPNVFGFIRYGALNRAAARLMARVGLGDVDPAVPVGSLGIGRRQMVEIAAGLSGRCRILVLDEPTTSLTRKEIDLLFDQIRRLKARGVAIVYISHRIEEVTSIADRVTVLRDGRIVSTSEARSLTPQRLIRLMVGRDIEQVLHRQPGSPGPTALRVVGLSRRPKVRNVNFELHAGEILGVAGLMGSGRTEIMRALFGADRPDAGDIFLDGSAKPTRIRSPRHAVRNGIALLTEDRKEQGLLLTQPVRANICLTRLEALSRFGWLDLDAERNIARQYAGALAIRCASTDQQVAKLSGGNQQKVVIAKWLFRDCRILIFDEPTRGIDIGAKFEIYRMLAELAERGKAIIFVSSDLKELMGLCDRIMVVSAGTVAATFDRRDCTEEQIMTAAFSGYLSPSSGPFAPPANTDERA